MKVSLNAQTTLKAASASSYLHAKRLIDVSAAVFFLIALAPLLLIIALAIKLDSCGPVLFIQERVGSKPYTSGHQTVWGIRPFLMYKFRSMQHDADETVHQTHIRAYVQGETDENGQHELKIRNDCRVTRVGRLLRKTSLDELPQLLNVLKGEMSLVGPRPVPVYEFDAYPAHSLQRFAALPGITGLWQVRGRCSLTFKEQIELDIEYTRRQSLWLDAEILLRTIPAVILCRGAE